ncbi:MAG: alpha/beta hydrolase fold domain-containing protein [Planctomycetaceae bacterium]|nr:alpha/beta hydrolase fold domain-containing protein [Planctomycetaceae bacterium]
MKNNSSLLMIILASLFLSISVYAEPALVYMTQNDILYRDANEAKSDTYIKERCRLDIYYPANKEHFATVVWFHGGGIKGGNKSIPDELKEQGIAVVAVNYRLYPKVKCPVYIEDAAAAVAWVFENIAKHGGDPNKIFISGHSAGGYLVSMVGMDKTWLAKYNIDANKIAGIIPCSGQMITHMVVREERKIPDTQPIIDQFAPLYHMRADAPALILITGDRNLELLGRYEENAYMMRMMKVAGHQKTELYEIQGHNHGEMIKPAFTILLNYLKSRGI